MWQKFIKFVPKIQFFISMTHIKYLALMLVALLGMMACSSDDEGSNSPEGQYVFRNDTLLVAIHFSNGKAYKFDAFVKGGSVAQFYFKEVSGEYPKQTAEYSVYMGDELKLDLDFSSVDLFSASVRSCNLSRADWAWYYEHRKVGLPQRMNFKKDEKVLDMNGDGILDETQDF